MLEALREDFARLPALLALGPPPQPDAVPEPDELAIAEAAPRSSTERAAAEPRR